MENVKTNMTENPDHIITTFEKRRQHKAQMLRMMLENFEKEIKTVRIYR